MKRLYQICFFLVSSVLVIACNSSHLEIFPELTDSSLLEKKLTVAEMREDVEAFYLGALERHPALDHYTDLQELEEAVRDLQLQISDSMNRLHFYRIVGQLAHKFNDGHSFLIWPYQEYEKLIASGKKPFPLAVTLTPDGSIVTKNTYINGRQSVPAGARITGINGQSIQTLMDHMQKFAGGESRFLREQIITKRFGVMLWAVFGFIDDFELKWQEPVSRSNHTTQLLSKQNWHLQDEIINGRQDFYFKVISDDTAYLHIGSFDVGLDWFSKFIDQAFTDIKNRKITCLIIDLRENLGGNTDSATYLLSYIAHKEFRMISYMTEKLNQQNRGLFNYKGKAGELIQYDWDEWHRPIDNNNLFEGEVYILISPVTYSAAIVFSSAAQDHRFATLIGQKTEGYSNQTAQGNLFNLPHSQLRAYITTRKLVRPNGDNKVSGVIPDIPVTPNAEAIAAGYDLAINKVLSLRNSAD
ncbi:S41 family peptidase [Microbulbifer sp. PAAF003]|uniref:S41 family peptidase n=1 Tax=Microbulbifer sp. PAAF003 TaxID=3243375 RepID=UPI0040398CF9